MPSQQLQLVLILCVVFVLFVWGRWRYDVVAMLALFVAVLMGIVPSSEVFAGFGHPATITVAAVLILSRALANTGATEFIAKSLQPSARYTSLHIGAFSSIGAAMSTFMNNVGALGLMMPIAMHSTTIAKRSVSIILMPLSFASILGGLVTLVGTPPNIIIATYREQVSGEPFGMFDFSPVGSVVAISGVLFVAFLGWRLIPHRRRVQTAAQDLFDIEDYVAEVQIQKDSPLIDKKFAEVEKLISEYDVVIVGLIRGRQHISSIPRRESLREKDILIIEVSPDELEKFVLGLGLQVVGVDGSKTSILREDEMGLIEAVIPPRSSIVGRTVESLRLQRRYEVNLLAVSRQGRPYRGRLKSFRFRAGDVLLFHGDTERLQEIVSALSCLPLAERGLQFGKRRYALLAFIIFAVAILAAMLEIMPLHVAFGLAIVCMVVGNVIPVRELYDGIDWSIVVLLGAMIPFGGALQATGATDSIASSMLGMTSDASPIIVLILLLVITMTLSDILNNAATTVLMAPIGVSIANQLNLNVDPFLMAIAVGASCAFLTPIGHQNNTLIMGPGGYHFGDYWRMGLPLEFLIILVAVPMILLVWPF